VLRRTLPSGEFMVLADIPAKPRTFVDKAAQGWTAMVRVTLTGVSGSG
jgi:hypothetical protein